MELQDIVVLTFFGCSMVLALFAIMRTALPAEHDSETATAAAEDTSCRRRGVCYALGNRILRRVEPVKWYAVERTGFAHVQMRLEDKTGNCWTRGYRVCLN